MCVQLMDSYCEIFMSNNNRDMYLAVNRTAILQKELSVRNFDTIKNTQIRKDFVSIVCFLRQDGS